MKEHFNEEALLKYLEEKGNSQIVVQHTQPTIEDSFMQLMKQ